MVHTDQQPEQHLSPAQTARRILRATGALMLVQIIIRGFGFIEKMILSHFFGTGFQADAYSTARKIAMQLFQFGEQVIMHSFLPVFVARLREHGEKDAWRLASTAINILILLMGGLAVLGIVFTSQILPWFVPDWVKDFHQLSAHAGTAKEIARLQYLSSVIPLTVTLTRVMLVAVIFLTTSSLTYCLLNSYKQFALPAAADLALKGTVLVFAVMFAGKWGPLALGIGFVCGAIAKVVVHACGLGRRFLEYRPIVDVGHPGLGKFAILALPLILGVVFSSFRQIMDIRFTSALGEGSMSSLDYARNLCDLPVQFFPYAFGIALFPFLADIAVAGDRDRLRGMLMSATRMMILIFIPLAIALIVMRYPILHGIYGSQKFNDASAQLTAGPMQIYAAGMLIGALEIIVLQFFFAMSDTLRPTLVGVFLSPIHIGMAYVGIHAWSLGVVAIALALLTYKSVKVLVLYFMMRRKLGSLEGKPTLILLLKIALALVPFIAILLVGAHFLPLPGAAHGKIKKLLTLMPYLVVGMIGIISYIAMLRVMKVDEATVLFDRIIRKFRRKDGSKTTPSSVS